jgi:hypothetical protein
VLGVPGFTTYVGLKLIDKAKPGVHRSHRMSGEETPTQVIDCFRVVGPSVKACVRIISQSMARRIPLGPSICFYRLFSLDSGGGTQTPDTPIMMPAFIDPIDFNRLT